MVDGYNKIQHKFITKGECSICETETITELEHKNNKGESCNQLIPEQSVRVRNKKIEKLHTVAFVDSKEGDVTGFIKKVIKDKKWKLEDVILKLGMGS